MSFKVDKRKNKGLQTSFKDLTFTTNLQKSISRNDDTIYFDNNSMNFTNTINIPIFKHNHTKINTQTKKHFKHKPNGLAIVLFIVSNYLP